eukprot:SAG11_NODE_1272_length_5334_cov_11.636676_7_plen_87_part_00
MVRAPTDGWGDAPHRAASNHRSGSSTIWPLIMSWGIGVAVDVDLGDLAIVTTPTFNHVQVVVLLHHTLSMVPVVDSLLIELVVEVM